VCVALIDQTTIAPRAPSAAQIFPRRVHQQKRGRAEPQAIATELDRDAENDMRIAVIEHLIERVQ
jgi:hypothetical protein